MAFDQFETIYHQFYQKIYRIAFSVTKDVHLAEDVLQETFLKAFQRSGQLENSGKIGSWLSTVAKRTAIDFLRKEQKMPCPLEDLFIQEKECVEITAEYELTKEIISREIQKLKPEYREILELKWYYGLKENELMRELNISKGAVKTRLHRARRALKESLLKAM